MASQQSDRACTLCRQRRVRCDKTLPTCRRCSKFGQPCPGYPSRERFIDQSDTVRIKLNDQSSPSSTASAQQSSASLESSPRMVLDQGPRASQHRKNRSPRVFDAGSHRSPKGPTPQRLSISTTGTHGPSTPPNVAQHMHQQHLLEHVPPVGPTSEDFVVDVSMQQLLEDPGSDYFDLDIDSYYANGTNACGFFPGLPVSLPSDDEVGILDGIHDSHMTGHDRAISTTASGVKPGQVNLNKEITLLIHLFVNFLAPWMDLFDLDAYFTRVLPVDATPSVLLQSAVAAVAAKQTARHVMNGCAKSASCHYEYIMANYQDVTSNEWFYKAACYYDRGISQLRAQLQKSSVFADEHVSPRSTIISAVSHPEHTTPFAANNGQYQAGNKAMNAQCLFSAISIFSLYETLDDCLATSSQHLPGFLALFDNGGAPTVPQSLTAGRAAFWYFARKEALASYAHHTKPRIDPHNVSVWASAGMPIQMLHLFSPHSSVTNTPLALDSATFEDRDAAHRILIWTLTKVIDLITADDTKTALSAFSSQPLASASMHSTRPSSHTFDFVWSRLREFLTYWYEHRSSLLIPHGTIRTIDPYNSYTKAQRIIFFTSSTGAAVLQLYHFIQILLLINQPTNQMGQGSRLRMLKENSAEVEYHSREICAIALGRQTLAIQRHMSHPLQLAGAYFEAKEDRDAVYNLLREVAVETSSPIEISS